MRWRLIYLLAALMLAVPCTLSAQEAASDTLRTEGRSILSLKMQKRYVPVNRPFLQDGTLFANSFVTLVGSGYRQLADNYSNGPFVTVGFGKWVKPAHGFRLSVSGGYFFDNYDYQRVLMSAIRADYLFNLSAYVDGYNPYRRIEIHPLAGLGYSLSKFPGEKVMGGISAHLGINLSIRAFPCADIIVEPIFELQKDPRKLARMNVWRGYIPAFHMGVGTRLFLDKRNGGEDPGLEWFFTLSGGFQRQNSELGRNIAFFKAIGGSFAAGIGRYYSDILSFRMQVGYGWHYWKEIKAGEMDIYGHLLDPGCFPSSYYMVRLDGFVNFLPLFVKNSDLLSFSLMLGPELGILHKSDPYRSNIRYFYVGASAGLQFKCRIARGLSVYLEPRASYVPYSAYAFSSATENKNYYDVVLSLSLGIEYRLGMKRIK